MKSCLSENHFVVICFPFAEAVSSVVIMTSIGNLIIVNLVFIDQNLDSVSEFFNIVNKHELKQVELEVIVKVSVKNIFSDSVYLSFGCCSYSRLELSYPGILAEERNSYDSKENKFKVNKPS